VTATLSFKALWWSQAQMQNLNPNAPPPKTEVVELERWEYTDPIGVPHPDSVDAVLTLSTPVHSLSVQVNVQMTGRWKIGARSDREKAMWDQMSFLDVHQTLALSGGETREVRTAIDLAKKMEELSKDERWPWELSVNAIITDSVTAEMLATVSKNLPIRPGD
jgi:hypothetical protein